MYRFAYHAEDDVIQLGCYSILAVDHVRRYLAVKMVKYPDVVTYPEQTA